MSVIKVENLIKNYKKSTWKESEEDVKVLKGISFQAEQGEFVGIMGKSGCGKTTLLKNLGMIDKPTNGKIQFAGEDTDSLYGDKLAEIRNPFGNGHGKSASFKGLEERHAKLAVGSSITFVDFVWSTYENQKQTGQKII